ncbi:PfkB family carbohydrate kinase [Jiella mangrovi]|uniref:Ribokinase n=1 Tax=Jiella mangrovi TaxID=2821407 RepID=A0ABS4BI94_9HYPH|nr:PfkB family carbohydrate kinase [Jiella mangrovi]MBP0616479.1 ribokinase [Jiella mangrovi]
MARLVHIGGAVMDYVYHVSGLPERAAELMASSFARLPGGAVNMMVAARRTGLATACGGALGTGPDGDALRAFLADEDIDVLLAPQADIDSGNCVVLITPDAERSFISFPGAEAHVATFDALLKQLSPGDWLAVSGYVLSYPCSREAVLALVENVDPGVSVIFDPTPVIADVPQAALTRMLARASWMSANMRELATITGGPAGVDGAAALLKTRMPSCRGIVLRDGENGAHLVESGQESATVPGFRVAAIDTNGAGDTHLGAFVGALARDLTPLDAVRYANAASAIAVTRRGGASGPSHQEIIHFLSLADQDRQRTGRLKLGH